jgi:YegS/Rv2252/BmrU family lipid kinase
MRAILIVNPVSGRHGANTARVAASITEAVRTLAALGVDVQVRLTERPGHATELAARAVEEGADRVFAWGGDGTINEVAVALKGTGVALGIVPAGSGNGLARELRVPLDAARALRVAATGPVRPVDVGDIDGHPFLNVAGAGFDARVALAFNTERKGRLGLRSYVRITIRELRRFVAEPCRVIVGNEVIETRPLLIALANSAQYGNGARIAPDARIDDGLLDVVVVEATSPLRDLLRARRLFTGSLAKDPRTTVRRGACVRIESDGPRAAHVDGQPFQIGRDAVATVHALALHVVVPDLPRR